MISVDHALDLGRDVFAVPGPVTSPLAEVPLALIRDGATMIRGADDLLDDLGYASRLALGPPPDLGGDERRVYEALGAARLPDAIAAATSLPLSSVTMMLLSLELKGLVRSAGGPIRAPARGTSSDRALRATEFRGKLAVAGRR